MFPNTEEAMDPLRHPDLLELSRKLRRQLETVLAAEQEAAAATLRRRRTLRDRLLDAEDRTEEVVVHTAGNKAWTGRVRAVGADHLVLRVSDREVFISLVECVALEVEQ